MGVDKGDPRRWTVLFIFSVYSLSNAIQWVTYAPIATTVKEYFHLTTNELNQLSSVYMIVFAAGAFFTCTTFERWGVRRGVLVGCALNALGSILKLAPGLQVPCYAVLIVAQTLNAFAQLFVLSTPPLIAAQYFAPHQRAFATAIAATANNIGNAVALFLPPLVVRRGVAYEFYILFGVECGLCVSMLVAAFFFLKPPAFQAPSSALLRRAANLADRTAAANPGSEDDEAAANDHELMGSPTTNGESELPGSGNIIGKAVYTGAASSVTAGDGATASASAGSAQPRRRVADLDGTGSESKRRPLSLWRRVQTNEQVITFVEVGRTVYLLCRNRDFVFLLAAFSISMGSVWTYASVLAQILEPFGLSATLAGMAGALNVVVGVVFAYIVGLWVDRRRRYKMPVIVCLFGSVVCCIGLMVVMLKVSPHTSLMDGLSCFTYVLAGVFQNTATPISFEFAMEISYPLPESVPGAMLMAGANIVSLILLSVSSAMLGNGVPSTRACVNVVILITAVCALGTILAFIPREKLHRREAEIIAKENLLLAAQPAQRSAAVPKRLAAEEGGEQRQPIDEEPTRENVHAREGDGEPQAAALEEPSCGSEHAAAGGRQS